MTKYALTFVISACMLSVGYACPDSGFVKNNLVSLLKGGEIDGWYINKSHIKAIENAVMKMVKDEVKKADPGSCRFWDFKCKVKKMGYDKLKGPLTASFNSFLDEVSLTPTVEKGSGGKSQCVYKLKKVKVEKSVFGITAINSETKIDKELQLIKKNY